MNFTTCSTVFGEIAIVWSEWKGSPGIIRIVLPRLKVRARDEVLRRYGDAVNDSCREINKTARLIERFCAGSDVDFDFGQLRFDTCSAFQQRVLRAEYSIPYGFVSTYKRIADHIGSPGGARAAGNALAANPFPIIVPCHRAVRSDLRLGGFQGGPEMKKALLENEGNTFDDRMRLIDPSLYYLELW